MVDSWLQDVRYAARLLRRNPLFVLTAALSLAIGIGANTAVFAVASALLLGPPAGIADPDRLVDVGRSQNGSGFDNNSYPNYVDVRARNTVFTDVYAYRFGPEAMSLVGPDGAERIYGGMVTTNYFDVLGTRPAAGRFFTTDDGDQPGATPLVVLSHQFWTRRFNADRSIVGTTLSLNRRPFTVIGVAPPGFHGTTVLTADVWVPLNMAGTLRPDGAVLLQSRPSVWLVMGARLKPGVSVRQARAQLDAVGHALEREFPDDNRGRGLVVAASSPIPGNGAPVAAFMGLLMGIVGLVLAIACANVAGVLLTRATARRREIAVRLAIGAGRARVIRQMLIETSLLFVIGAMAGLALARVATTFAASALPALPVPIDVSLALDTRAVAFTLGLSLAAAILSGLAPALAASKETLAAALHTDAQMTPARQRLRNAFVVGQVALSVVLIVGAGLFMRALQRAASIDPGFDTHGVEIVELDLSLAGYTRDTGPVFARAVLERLRALPDVQSAAFAAMVPLGNGGLGLGGLSVPGAAPPPGRRFFDADWNVVTPGYFAMMKTRLVAGRDFTDADRADAPGVIVVNETAARRFWSAANAQDVIGRPILQQDGTADAPDRMRTLTVIGVAADTKYRSLGEAPRPFVYVPMDQQYIRRTSILARSAGGRRFAGEIKALIASLNPDLPIVTAQSFDEYASLGLIPQRAAASVSASVGLVALLLAAIGIYGVAAFAVTSRTREIGIRIALGAQPAQVLRMVLRQGMVLTATGAAIGVGLAVAASRLLGSLLFGVGAADPAAFGGSVLLFATVGLAASYLPARRATAIDPTSALRQE